MASQEPETPIQLSDEFKAAMKEWTELKQMLKKAADDLKPAKIREKELKLYVSGYMKAQKIDTCNLRRGKVKCSTKQSKKPINKQVIRTGLLTFFDGNQERMEGAWDAIENAREVRETNSLRVSGLNTPSDE